MPFKFTVVCPKCNKISTTVAAERYPEPHVSCGDCLMDHVEVVQMKVVVVNKMEE